MNEYEWLQVYLQPLVGAIITAVEVDVEDDGLWPVLSVATKTGGKLTIEVSRDEEGNGPGFLFGLPMPEQPAA